MKLKGIKLEGTYKIVCYPTCFEIYDEKGNPIYYEENKGRWAKWERDEKGYVIYYENSDGYWERSKYDEKGNEIYYEDSRGFWAKWEYDKEGNRSYYKNNRGTIIDKRVKELTVKEIEELLGYKIKIKGK
ncbi:hypothetical protein [Methanoculleus sp.]|uniref:hypothetical protein n=1 Tax=Methanoculleus sp. TaxID=90427 RepID=UPI0025DB48EC|nr:hypothetical protein [Methanoculleus sp.]MCK9320354.1 hypothetical protein [Methanoculleus sp.]